MSRKEGEERKSKRVGLMVQDGKSREWKSNTKQAILLTEKLNLDVISILDEKIDVRVAGFGATGTSKASDKCSFAKISGNNKDWCNGRGKPAPLRKARGIVQIRSRTSTHRRSPYEKRE